MKWKRHRIMITMAAALAAIVSSAQWTFKLDTTFRTQIQRMYVNSVMLLADGNLIVSGNMRFPGDLSNRSLVRLLPDGTRDETFNNSSLGGGKLTPWEDRFYVGTSQLLRRIFYTGQSDPTFIGLNTGPYFQSVQGGDHHVFDDGRVLITGRHILSDTGRGFVGYYNLIWFSNQGYLDTTRIHRQANGDMTRFKQLTNGKFLMSCYCSSYDGQPVGRLFRIHPDGTLDTTFQTSINTGTIDAMLELQDGRILIGGNFMFSNSSSPSFLVRLWENGELDASFNNDLHVATGLQSGFPKVMLIRPWEDDKYFIGGTFSYVNNEPRGTMAVVDTAGQLLSYLEECEAVPYQYQGFVRGTINGMSSTLDGEGYYVWGSYVGYNDGTTYDTQQRFVSRLLVEEDLTVDVAEEGSITTRDHHLYPNPTDGLVTFTFIPSASANIVIRDLSGRIISNVPMTRNDGRQIWDTKTLVPGTYIVEFVQKGIVLRSEKLIVQR